MFDPRLSAALLTTVEMAAADRRAAEHVPSLTLMENAGRAVADVTATLARPGARIAVLCGPGNNGGDGFVAARHLEGRGYTVEVARLGGSSPPRGDAAEMAARWTGRVRPTAEGMMDQADLIIDALFGAGLTRPLAGEAGALVQSVNRCGRPVLAVDVPSGLDGTTGQASGPVIEATGTVTFFRRKPGHLLLPGRKLCGPVTVADIGIPDNILETVRPGIFANTPELWRAMFPEPHLEDHKYQRGHAVVLSGPAASTGAARLGARGALRIGAGLVTVASPPGALAINAAHLTSIMLLPCGDAGDLAAILGDQRRNAVLIGPGCGVGDGTRVFTTAALESNAAVVLDADALTSFEGRLSDLIQRVGSTATRPVVLTPHEGEFRRLFGALGGSKLDRVRTAAAMSSAVVILKGADTVIASPGGQAVINDNAPPWLATAGSGDVLAGFVTGLLAQRMPVFAAACAAVWLHGACATAVGPGLIAEDLPEVLPGVLRNVLSEDRSWGPAA